MSYHCLDFEASSLDLTNSWPIQVAWSVGDKVNCYLVKPESEWCDWDEESFAIHQIEKEQAMDEGKSVHWLAQQMNQDLGEQKVFVTAPRYDGFWLQRLFQAANSELKFEVMNFADFIGLGYSVLEDRAWRLTQGRQHDAGVDVECMLNMIRLKLGVL